MSGTGAAGGAGTILITGTSATGSITETSNGSAGSGGYGVDGANGGAGGNFTETLVEMTTGDNAPVAMNQQSQVVSGGDGGDVVNTGSGSGTVAGSGGAATGSATGAANGNGPVSMTLFLQGGDGGNATGATIGGYGTYKAGNGNAGAGGVASLGAVTGSSAHRQRDGDRRGNGRKRRDP